MSASLAHRMSLENHEEPATCVIAGEAASFSDVAARQLFPSGKIQHVPSFDRAVQGVVAGDADCAVLPIYNRIAGPVEAVWNAIEEAQVKIVGDHWLPVRMHLIGVPGSQLSDIRTVVSHPVALRQCTRFLATLPHLSAHEGLDTASSVREVVEGNDLSAAAIASEEAAAHYGGVVLSHDIHDERNNATRFAVVTDAREVTLSGNCLIVSTSAETEAALLSEVDPLLRTGMTLRSKWHTSLAGKSRYFVEFAFEANGTQVEAVTRWRESSEAHRVLGSFTADAETL